jgi:cation transport regulator ChaB
MEITFQLSPPLSESLRELANEQFKGNLEAALNAALEFYLDKNARKRRQLKN